MIKILTISQHFRTICS